MSAANLPSELRFHLAGLDVVVRGTSPDALDDVAAGYRDRAYAPRGEPRLSITIERIVGLGDGKPQGPEHPAFRKDHRDGTLLLERVDASGEIYVGDGTDADAPMAARFRVSESPNSLEACLRIALSVALPRVGAFILHSSAVRAEGHALVFTGVSGAGKSTIASLLATVPGVARLVDELGIVRVRDDGGVELHTAPFLGVPGMPWGARAPVEAFHFLVQAPGHERHRIAPRAALRPLMANVLAYVAEPTTADHLLSLMDRVVAAVPCYQLEFAKDPGVATVLGIAS